jgi:hypothetical protein
VPSYGPIASQLDTLNAYRAFKAQGGGDDRKFLASGLLASPPSEPTLRRWLALWRGRASQGLDPLTGKPSESASALATELGQASPPKQAAALKTAQAQRQAKAATPQELIDARKAELQAMTPDQRRIKKAERVLDKVLAGRPVKPAQHKAAEQVLVAAGRLGRKVNEDKAKASEFTSWPTPALVDLLNELGAVALVTRHDPAPPVVIIPADERDAARLEEASSQPTATLPSTVKA